MAFKRAQTWAVAALVLVCAGYSVAVKIALDAPRGTDKLRVGSVLAPLALPDLEGNVVDVQALAKDKKVVLLAFWASWCAPCRLEMPRLMAYHQNRAQDGFAVVSINVDKDEADRQAYLDKHPLPFPVLLEPSSELMKKFGLGGLPSAIVLDPEGKVIDVLEGEENKFLRFKIEGWLGTGASPTGFPFGGS